MNMNNDFCKSGFCLILLGLLFIFKSCMPIGVNNDSEVFNKIFRHIYNQNFDSATSTLIYSVNDLDELNYKILELDLLWWKAISKNQENDLLNFENILSRNFKDIIDRKNQNKFEKLIYYSYSFRLSVIKNHQLSIVADLIKINHIIEQIEKEKLIGESRVIFEIYKAIFNIGKSSFLFNYSKLRDAGIKVLESNVNSTDIVYQTISGYFLSKIYMEIDKTPEKARIYCEQLCKLYPGNKIFASNLEKCKFK